MILEVKVQKSEEEEKVKFVSVKIEQQVSYRTTIIGCK